MGRKIVKILFATYINANANPLSSLELLDLHVELVDGVLAEEVRVGLDVEDVLLGHGQLALALLKKHQTRRSMEGQVLYQGRVDGIT